VRKEKRKNLLQYLALLVSIFLLVATLVHNRKTSTLRDLREYAEKRKIHAQKPGTHQKRVFDSLSQISQKLKRLETEMIKMKKELDHNKTR